ncbi:tRNA/rRNA methyltransferase [Bacteroidia bacterium]|nr:tRNA/rRNA methyltransferase [Bacteroidia bacterium]
MNRADIQFVQSLRLKKNRDESRLFIAEGKKLVDDLLHSLKPYHIYGTEDCDAPVFSLVSQAEMKKMSGFATPSTVLGVFYQPAGNLHLDFTQTWCVALDGVQDPGNVGTIIRLCDWFGIDTLLCSPTTADGYAPKVVQATMGAIARIRLIYSNLATLLPTLNTPIFGTFLEGKNIYQTPLPQSGIIVLGSEGQGISKEVAAVVQQKLYIPSFAKGKRSESLNVAMATAVVCSEICRGGVV